MSISNTNYIQTGIGDGSTVTFSFPFEIFEASDLQVNLINTTVTPNISTAQALTTNFSVTINPAAEGGSITFVTAPTLNWQVQIIRIRPFTQTVVLANEGALPAAQLEDQLDSITMLCIQMNGYIQQLQVAFAAIAPTYNIPGLVPSIPTVASAATVAITQLYGAIILSGTTQVNTINGGFTGQVMTFICTSGLTFGTSGNIKIGKTVAANGAGTFIFDGTNWHPTN